jgi:hypothetical protein
VKADGGVVHPRIPAAGASEVEGVYAFFGFQFRHGVADPLLEVVAEPHLYTICKPDGFSFDKFGRRPVRGALEVLSSFRQVFTTYEHAQIAITVKLQVAVVEFVHSQQETAPSGWDHAIVAIRQKAILW